MKTIDLNLANFILAQKLQLLETFGMTLPVVATLTRQNGMTLS